MLTLNIPEVAADSAPDVRDVLFRLQNNARQYAYDDQGRVTGYSGLAPLSWRDELEDVAGSRVADMVARGYFAHETPEGQSGYVQALTAAGLWNGNLAWSGENIAETNAVGAPELAQHEVAAWMASPTHKANILSPDFNACGFGVGLTPAGVYICCCIFAGFRS